MSGNRGETRSPLVRFSKWKYMSIRYSFPRSSVPNSAETRSTTKQQLGKPKASMGIRSHCVHKHIKCYSKCHNFRKGLIWKWLVRNVLGSYNDLRHVPKIRHFTLHESKAWLANQNVWVRWVHSQWCVNGVNFACTYIVWYVRKGG